MATILMKVINLHYVLIASTYMLHSTVIVANKKVIMLEQRLSQAGIRKPMQIDVFVF